MILDFAFSIAVAGAVAGAVILKRDRAPPRQKQTSTTQPLRTYDAPEMQQERSSYAQRKPLALKASTMDHTVQHAALHTEPRTQYAPTTQECTYTTQQLAEKHSVKPTTVASWISRWLSQVAPETLLKKGKGIYTELAHTLLSEFVQVHEKERHAWVSDAKERYSREWKNVGVIDCEVMPDNVGNALALIQTNLESANHSLSLELYEVGDFINQLNSADADFTQAEVEGWAAAGARKAVAQFKTEEVARAQTLNALRQQRLQGGQKDG